MNGAVNPWVMENNPWACALVAYGHMWAGSQSCGQVVSQRQDSEGFSYRISYLVCL